MGKIYEKEVKHYSGMPAASLTLGIISILTIIFWYMSLITGILAIVFGVKSIHRINSKLGKAGMVLGIIGLSIFAFIYISLVMLIALSNL